MLLEISNASSAQPLKAAEPPSRKRKAAASKSQVQPVTLHISTWFSRADFVLRLQDAASPADFLSPRERILALRDAKKSKKPAAAAPAPRAIVASADADGGGGSHSGEWQLAAATESLVLDLLSPTWFIRHGCALGLIEILTVAGSCVGCCDGLDPAQQRAANADFLGGAAACLLVVLALDRYADFDSQVCYHMRQCRNFRSSFENTHPELRPTLLL
jgi:hypothetical protein